MKPSLIDIDLFLRRARTDDLPHREVVDITVGLRRAVTDDDVGRGRHFIRPDPENELPPLLILGLERSPERGAGQTQFGLTFRNHIFHPDFDPVFLSGGQRFVRDFEKLLIVRRPDDLKHPGSALPGDQMERLFAALGEIGAFGQNPGIVMRRPIRERGTFHVAVHDH